MVGGNWMLDRGEIRYELIFGQSCQEVAYNLPLDPEMQDMNEVRRGPDRSYVYVQLR